MIKLIYLQGKISLFSRYERVTDRRTFKDRRDLWAIEKKKEDVVLEKPKAKIKSSVPIKPRNKKVVDEEEEEHHGEEQHEEETGEH